MMCLNYMHTAEAAASVNSPVCTCIQALKGHRNASRQIKSTQENNARKICRQIRFVLRQLNNIFPAWNTTENRVIDQNDM